MGVSPTIRVATAEDAERLSELAARTFRETFAPDNTAEDMAAYLAATFTPERQRSELEDPGQRVLLLEIDGVPVGYAQLARSAPDAAVRGDSPIELAIELARFYLDGAWHGRGLAQQLMGAVVDEAVRLGARTLWLGVWERNPRAIAFYRKHGFVDVGAHPFVLGRDVQTDRIMQRPLGPPAAE